MIAGLYKIFDHWHQEGTLWIYSDTHFGDKDLRQGIHNRPSDEELVKTINMYQLMKQGLAARIDTIHRETIDKATKRKKKRGGKKIGE